MLRSVERMLKIFDPDRKGKAINVKTESTIIEKEIRDKTGNDKFDKRQA